MVIARKKRPPQGRKGIGLTAAQYEKLNRVCQYRGWQKTTAVERLADRELAEIERERQPSS